MGVSPQQSGGHIVHNFTESTDSHACENLFAGAVGIDAGASAPPAGSTSTTNSFEERLQKLKKLKEKGLVSVQSWETQEVGTRVLLPTRGAVSPRCILTLEYLPLGVYLWMSTSVGIFSLFLSLTLTLTFRQLICCLFRRRTRRRHSLIQEPVQPFIQQVWMRAAGSGAGREVLYRRGPRDPIPCSLTQVPPILSSGKVLGPLDPLFEA